MPNTLFSLEATRKIIFHDNLMSLLNAPVNIYMLFCDEGIQHIFDLNDIQIIEIITRKNKLDITKVANYIRNLSQANFTLVCQNLRFHYDARTILSNNLPKKITLFLGIETINKYNFTEAPEFAKCATLILLLRNRVNHIKLPKDLIFYISQHNI